jgi:hypothetical protein
VVPPDHDGRFHFSLGHHLVEGEAEAMPVAQAHPADARRQALEFDARPGHVEPVVEVRVVRHELFHPRIGAIDVFGIARQRRPPERADAAAEQRADVGRHEARKIKGVGHAFVLGHLADVVAVIDRGNAAAMKFQHRPHMLGHGTLSGLLYAFGIGPAPAFPVAEGPSLRQVAVDRVMRRCLVRHHVGPDAAPHQLGKNLGRIAEQPHR